MYRMIGADGREYGPISADQLRQWIGQGRANAATNVLPEGATEWKPLGSLPEFSMLFVAPTQPTTQQPPSHTPAAPAVFPSYTVPPQRTSGFAIAALVLGILAVLFGLCCCYGLPFSIPGLIFAFIGLGQINSQPDRYDGKTMAIIAIILCCLSLLMALIMFCLGMASVFWGSGSQHHGYRL